MRLLGYAWAAGATAACTLVGLAMAARFELVNIAMLYLLTVILIALRFSRGPTLVSSILSVAAFDFFFVPPPGTFAVDEPQHLLTFGMMLALGLLISGLTESVRARAKAQAAFAIEAETERIRSALLASISHDLRTPLAVITGASSSLAQRGERLSAAERAALAHTIVEHSQHMSELMAKVLEMTRLESGAIALERDWHSLGEIAGAVLRRLRERLASHMIMVELPDDLPLVRVEASLIEQVLGNLLENAARYSPPRTLIRLRAIREDREIVVSVQDFGAGLPEGELKRIFDKFHHGSAGGVGLGLAICRAIVRLHGGRIWAQGIPAGGIAFRFTLPLEKQPALPVEALAS